VLAGSAFLTFIAIAIIQIPLQIWTINSMSDMWGEEAVLQWALLAGIPNIVYTGLVQEGAKLVPILIYRWRTESALDPRLMLVVGAVAGAGFGIFETQWAHNSIIASGWTWDLVRSEGVIALAGFWERFFTIGFHTGASALVAYGLSKGKGVLFYFLAAIAHAVLNYSVLLVQKGIFSFAFAEVYIAVIALIVAGTTIWLRWRKQAAG
jgi:RsiW-degrading membrane proteinase PrsW (M82 family)